MKKGFCSVSIGIVLILLMNCSVYTQSWTIQNSNTTQQLKGIHMVNELVGWICGDGGALLHTTTGGQTWTPVPIIAADLHSVVFKDQNTGIVVGDNGIILRTTNAGTNWNQVNSTTSSQLRAAAVSNAGIF